MSAELDEVAKSLYNGQLPSIWRALAPATLKGLGNWIIHFHKRNQQYTKWVGIYMLHEQSLQEMPRKARQQQQHNRKANQHNTTRQKQSFSKNT